MKLKVVIILVVGAGLILGALNMMGFRLRFGKDKRHTQGSAQAASGAFDRELCRPGEEARCCTSGGSLQASGWP